MHWVILEKRVCRRAWKALHGMGHLACSFFFTAEKVVLVDSLSRRLVAPCDGPMLVSFWAISDKIRMVEHN